MTSFNKTLSATSPIPKQRHRRLEQGLRVLPNLFTLGNGFFGFASIAFAACGDFVMASYSILLGALMDNLDGRIARYARVTSELGMQLDSLCDGITFGMAPAMLLYLWQLKKLGALGDVFCALFLMAGLLRLARFNLMHTKQDINSSIGLPIPMAGCFLAALYLNTRTLIFGPTHMKLLVVLVCVLAGLMISTLPFPTFKHTSKTTLKVALFGLTSFLITMGFTRLLLLIFISYFIIALVNLLREKTHQNRSLKNS